MTLRNRTAPRIGKDDHEEEAMNAERDCSEWRWTLTVLGLLALIAVAARLLPGTGVQARLDASRGLSDSRFLASQERAMRRMSVSQINAFEWAMMRGMARLGSDDAFVRRYGVSPTVRDVVVGEVMLAVDAGRRQVQDLKTGLAVADQPPRKPGAPHEDASHDFKPPLTRVYYDDSLPGMAVRYRLDGTSDRTAWHMWCQLTYRVRYLQRQHQVDFICMSPPKMPDGEYRLMLFPDIDVPAEDLIVLLRKYDGPADPASTGSSLAISADKIDRSVELRAANRQMKSALDLKATM